MATPRHDATGPDAPPAVRMEGVSFAYDGSTVLEEVDLEIPQGDYVGIVGPNGGGKTTLLRLIVGLEEADRGTVRVFGLPPTRARHAVGYMPQHTLVDPQFPVNVTDVVLTGRLGRRFRVGPYGRADREAAARALEEVDAAELAKRPFASLSGGQRQRVLIARALVSEPRMLLLDEPTASLDALVETEFYDLLARLNETLTVVLVSHDVGFVMQGVKRVVCVRGTVVTHPTDELTGDLLRELYAADVCLVRHDHAGDGRPDEAARDRDGPAPRRDERASPEGDPGHA